MHTLTHPAQHHSRRGYTLIEIIVAAAVLGIIGFLLVQIVTATTMSTGVSAKAVDASSQAREAFERIRLDLTSRLPRADADFIADNLDTGDTLLTLLSEVTSEGYDEETNRGISVLQYRIGTHDEVKDAAGQPRSCLLRAGKALSWDDTKFLGIKSTGLPVRFKDAEYEYLPEDDDFQVVAPGVLHMAVGFRLFPDAEDVTLQNGTTIQSLGQLVYSPPVKEIEATDGSSSVQVVDTSRIGALVVGVVSLDLESANLLTNAHFTSLVDQFSIPADQETFIETWAPVAEGLASDDTLSAIPLKARQAVRVYQRAFPITMRMEVQ